MNTPHPRHDDLTPSSSPRSLRGLLTALRDRSAVDSSVLRKGMTLIEIMIVLTIMAAIMGVVGWSLLGQSDKANIKTTETQIKSFKGPLQLYRQERNKFPDDLSELVDGGYMPELPTDAWGNEFGITVDSRSEVTVFSPGPDETPNNDDDVTIQLKF